MPESAHCLCLHLLCDVRNWVLHAFVLDSWHACTFKILQAGHGHGHGRGSDLRISSMPCLLQGLLMVCSGYRLTWYSGLRNAIFWT